MKRDMQRTLAGLAAEALEQASRTSFFRHVSQYAARPRVLGQDTATEPQVPPEARPSSRHDTCRLAFPFSSTDTRGALRALRVDRHLGLDVNADLRDPTVLLRGDVD